MKILFNDLDPFIAEMETDAVGGYVERGIVPLTYANRPGPQGIGHYTAAIATYPTGLIWPHPSGVNDRIERRGRDIHERVTIRATKVGLTIRSGRYIDDEQAREAADPHKCCLVCDVESEAHCAHLTCDAVARVS